MIWGWSPLCLFHSDWVRSGKWERRVLWGMLWRSLNSGRTTRFYNKERKKGERRGVKRTRRAQRMFEVKRHMLWTNETEINSWIRIHRRFVFRATQLQTQQRLNLTLCGLNCESFAWQEEEYESSAGATTLTFALCCWLTYGIVSFYFNIWGERERTLCKSTRYFIQLQILIRGRRQGTHRLSLHHITMMSHRQVIVRCEKLR